MKRTLVRLRALAVITALGSAFALSRGFAQEANTPPAPPADQAPAPAAPTAPVPTTTTTGNDQENVVQLSPFVVEASEEAGTYQAQATTAGTRIRTDLSDLASATSVVTQQFLQDTNANNTEDLLVYTPNTEVGGLHGNFSGQAQNPIYQEPLVNPQSNTRVRGLDTADDTRDFFLSDIPWDSFDTDRIDLQRGPNSILFGSGSPAGIINNALDNAEFKNSYHVEDVTSSFGSQRETLNVNQVLLPQELAVRFAVLSDDEKYQQDYAYNNDVRYYGALRFDPKIINAGNAHTSLTVKFEHGDVTSNNPRDLPPVDELGLWFQSGVNSNGVAGFNKAIANQWTTEGSQDYTGSVAYTDYDLGGWAQGRTYWPTALNYFNGAGSTVPAGVNTSIPTNVVVGGTNWGSSFTPLGANLPGDPTVSLPLSFPRPVAVEPFSDYAANAAGFETDGVLGGGPYYADKVITNTSVFNFYNTLLDGPTKEEWQNWDALNASLSQTFFDDRLAFLLSFDHQDYNSGQQAYLSGETYAISVDVNATFADGDPNPNVGRPYVASSGYSGGNYDEDIVRDTTRFLATADLDSKDYFGNNLFTEILGRSVFSGLLEEDDKRTFYYNYASYGTTTEYDTDVLGIGIQATGQNDNQFDWIDYLGPSLLNASSDANAHIGGITTQIEPKQQEQETVFNYNWNPNNTNGFVTPASAVTNQPIGGYPAAPTTTTEFVGAIAGNTSEIPNYDYTGSNGGNIQSLGQIDNPANYVGWTTETVNYLNAKDPNDLPDLVANAYRELYRDINEGITWQGYLFDSTLVPTVGWRKDVVTTYDTNAPNDPNTGLTPLNFTTNEASRIAATGESKSWGGVYHFPKSLTSHLPWGTNISLFYDRSNNFKADVPRQNLVGLTIPNQSGDTKEYGFTISTLDDKLSLKVDWYQTHEYNATLDSTNGNSIAGLGANGYYQWAWPAWGYFWAAQLQDGLAGKLTTSGNTYWDYGNATLGSGFTVPGSNGATYGLTGPITSYSQEKAFDAEIVNAWVNLPLPSTFFDYYGIHPYTINPANADGELSNAIGGTPNGFLALEDSAAVSAGNSGFDGVGNEQPGSINAVSTVSTVSKGQEFELTGQPLKNWNLTVNYVRTFATHTGIDPTTQTYMADMYKFMTGPGGALRAWGNGAGNEMGSAWVVNIYDPYTVELNSQGKMQAEVPPWALNGITTYTFDRGPLKNAFIGGGLRVEAGRILGYRYSPTVVNIDGIPGGLDVNEPLWGPSDEHVDLWAGYVVKLPHRINWRIQINLTNVGQGDSLVPDRYEPDGSLALARIQEGMTWALTNAFDF